METQCGIGKPITRKLHGCSWTRWMLVGKIVGHLFTFNINQQCLLRVSLRLSSVLFMWAAASLVESSLGFLDASVASRSVSRHTWERGCCLSWQLLRRPGGLIGCQTSAHEKANQMGEETGPASGNLTTCLPVLHLPLPPLWWLSSPLLPREQQGKLYRPKGRLTSPESWNRSD